MQLKVSILPNQAIAGSWCLDVTQQIDILIK